MLDRSVKARRTTLAVGIVASTTVLLAGCGGSSDNGEAKKTGPQVATDAANALKAASAFHVTGTVKENGQPMSVDMQIQQKDVSGSIKFNDAAVSIIKLDGKVYIKGNGSFWKLNQVPAQTAALLDGRWVLAPSSESSDFTDFSASGLAADIQNPPDSSYETQVHKAKVDGKSVVVVMQKDGSELDVAANGTPYPLRIVNKGSEAGTQTFSGYGQPQTIKAPPSPLDFSSIS